MYNQFKNVPPRICFLGKFRGKGVVLDNGLKYKEELIFKMFKNNIIHVHSQTYTDDSSRTPIHMETGILKFPDMVEKKDEQPFEASFVHPFSLAEYEYGTYYPKEQKMELELKHLLRGDYKKGRLTTAFKRVYWLNKRFELNYKMYLGLDNKEPYHHLEATLRRISI